MVKAELHRGDGLPRGRSWLRSVVRNLQRGLADAGHGVQVDGLFGNGTEGALRDFQDHAALAATGVADVDTWSALEPHLVRAAGPREQAVREHLSGFRGDLEFVHQQEGHRGRPYWPGGASGVTLDPGVDLGQVPAERMEELYGPLLAERHMRLLRRVLGLRGESAGQALRRHRELKGINISEEQATEIMRPAATPYWDGIRRRFPALSRADTPPSVQSVMLSLAYNRGFANTALDSLGPRLMQREWSQVAGRISRMQQRHRLEGIRKRRRREASLIRAELEFMATD